MEGKIILKFFNKDLTIGSNLELKGLKKKEEEAVFEFEDLFKKVLLFLVWKERNF